MSNTRFPIARSNDSEKLLDRVATKTAPKPKTKRNRIQQKIDESGLNLKQVEYITVTFHGQSIKMTVEEYNNIQHIM